MSRHPQSKKSTFRVSEVLKNPESSLGNLLRQAGQLERLEILLRDLVGPELATRFQVAAVRKNRLILIVPTAAWATRFRMQAPRIVSGLQDVGITSIEHIDIRVAPLVEPEAVQRKRRPLSPAARQALEFMSELESSDTK
jgi:hypothetical protein